MEIASRKSTNYYYLSRRGARNASFHRINMGYKGAAYRRILPLKHQRSNAMYYPSDSVRPLLT